MDSLIVQIRNEISKGNSEEAIKLIRENFATNKKIQDQILYIAGRANELEQKVLRGIVSEAEAHLRSNQIRDSLIRLVNQIEKKEADNGPDLFSVHWRLVLFSLLGFTGIIMIMLLIHILFFNRINPLKMQNEIYSS